ncbi:hypothetical protein [Dermacoccus sp. Ellin185]|uniref:hypothetical protein n=1 Tax=Dermacoccus sp. Ellin185 TaxID=188626 RepID=UPI000587E2AE|nr:hypothetical protein [Dermacoccus sp. Ellin185]HCQ19326.1 hypothetical protein [Dermacoccus sp.]
MCLDIDREYVEADPSEYFFYRLEGLSQALVQRPSGPRSRLAAIEHMIGPTAARTATPAGPTRGNGAHLAMDAFLLRHQVGEALLRHIYGRLAARDTVDGPRSIRVEISESPNSIIEVIKAVTSQLNSPHGHAILAGILLPLPDGSSLTQDHLRAIDRTCSWINRSITVTLKQGANLGGAANKIKHGVAARVDDHLLASLTIAKPDDQGRISAKVLNGPTTAKIFDKVTIDFLHRRRATKGEPPPGLDRTILHIDPLVIVSEAWLLALVLRSMIKTAHYRLDAHSAALVHDTWRGLLDSPSPEDLAGVRPVGIRLPLSTTASPSGIHWPDETFQKISFGKQMKGVVID